MPFRYVDLCHVLYLITKFDHDETISWVKSSVASLFVFLIVLLLLLLILLFLASFLLFSSDNITVDSPLFGDICCLLFIEELDDRILALVFAELTPSFKIWLLCFGCCCGALVVVAAVESLDFLRD